MKRFVNDAGSRVAEVNGTLMQNVPFQAAGPRPPSQGFCPVLPHGTRATVPCVINSFNLSNSINLFVVLVSLVAVFVPASVRAADNEGGVALAIVYDTSGSMKENVKDEHLKPSPKYVIANRALISISKQIQRFITNTPDGSPRKVDAGLFIFEGDSAKQVFPVKPFDGKAIEDWASNFSNPHGSTPLGKSLSMAANAVLSSELPHKHILVITDGMNTVEPKPEKVMPGLQRRAEQKGTSLSVHFVAFDVAAKVFDPMKKLGATVVAAADERQLDSQLQFILERKILLEDEEPPKKK